MNQIHQTLNMLSQAGRVRLDTEEIDALAYALEGLAPARVALFGSRVEPDRRGGDVDLLIPSDAPAYELSKRVATRFYYSRCEERIGVVILPAHGATAEQQAFLNSIIGGRPCPDSLEDTSDLPRSPRPIKLVAAS